MEKFEYVTYSYDTSGVFGGKINNVEFNSKLNLFGNEGWELISCVNTNQDFGSSRSIICVFKRPLKSVKKTTKKEN